MITILRKSKWVKGMAMLLSLNLFFEICYPTVSFALTSGPSQPEVQSFEPIGTSQMVDVFTGDFTYNIPLLDVGGYPINISYNSGVSMDQEASWVGLGWNLNPGAVTRSMRGIPDDFSGDQIQYEKNQKPNVSYGLTLEAPTVEIFGLGGLSVSYAFGINYNNYNGIGFTQELSAGLSKAFEGKDNLTGSLGFSLSNSTTGGPSLGASASLTQKSKIENGMMKETSTLGLGVNTRGGTARLSFAKSTETEVISSAPPKKSEKGKKETAEDPRTPPPTGFNGGASISFAGSTYTPQVEMDKINSSLAFKVKIGTGIFGGDVDVELGGYYSRSDLYAKEKTTNSYGYIYSDKASPGNTTLDFNREKDGSFTKNSINLPLTNNTYDIFSVAGQGVGGVFRPFSGDVGKVYDPETYSYSAEIPPINVEIGSGNLVDVGLDPVISGTVSSSGYWNNLNPAGYALSQKSIQANSDYEPVYFKEAGEKSVDDDDVFLNGIGRDRAVRIPIQESGGYNTKTKLQYVDKYAGVTSIPGTGMRRNKRVKRNQTISYLRADEAALFGVKRYASPYAKSHHIAEVHMTRSDGGRYIYGIAAYNIFQKEMTFNVSGLGGSCSLGEVTYNTTDASKDNTLGIDNYYSSTRTPAYAHSYLLTSFLSPDYVDVDGVDGPSPGDLGSYVKFNYDADENVDGIQPEIPNYGWRTPYSTSTNVASYSEGLKSDPYDDKGNIIYGEKEVWYLKTIESKTYVAVFHTSNRKDGFEAAGINGGMGTDAMMKLDKISLYSLPDYEANGTAAYPIKEVHFVYNYSLCQSVDNNDGNTDANNPVNEGGKLTLTEIYFTYGNSGKGKLSGYHFTYGENHSGQTYNPSYNNRAYDRWGNYKADAGDCAYSGTAANNAEFPYSTQVKSTADNEAISWNLSSIKMPSGGIIKVYYEADDYSYVQDRPAMRMFKVAGAGSTSDPDYMTNSLFEISGTVNDYIFFERDSDPNLSIDEYVKNLQTAELPVYFRFAVNLGASSDDASREYVSGYFNILDAGIISNSNYGYVKVEKVNDGDGSVLNSHPVSKASWQFGRKYNPRVVYDLPSPTGTSAEDIFSALGASSIVSAVVEIFEGPNGVIKEKYYGREFVPGKSFIRLYNPNNGKIGGGSRVKQIRMSDEWSGMNSAGTTSEYGQEYEYKLEDGKSSGVAAYEPTIGGDENPFRRPLFISESNLLAPDEGNYVEEPFGESFFPSASVGYSRVTVKNLSVQDVNRHATGKIVHEFYTTKDFPTFTDRTNLQIIQKRSSIAAQILKLSLRDFMTASQGFVVELNDMNGKPKSQMVYAEDKTDPLTSVEYVYQQKLQSYSVPGFSGTTVNRKVLDNTVDVIKPTGEVTQAEIGVDYDVINDFRQSNSLTYTYGGQGNLAAFLAAIIPVAIPFVLPNVNSERTMFKSVSTTKVVNRYGILKETIAYDLGSKVSTENLAWDAQTGEVLLTKTNNEFNDPVYNFNYPAHWAYSGMSQAYKNIGYTCTGNVTGGVGAFITSNSSEMLPLHKGDEVVLYKMLANSEYFVGKYWVWDRDNDVTNGVFLVDKYGVARANTNDVKIKVIRSGRRNQQAISIGSVTSSQTPLRDTNMDTEYDAISFDAATTEIINASSVEFAEEWGMFCDQQSSYASEEVICTEDLAMLTDIKAVIQYAIDNGGICQQNLAIPPGTTSQSSFQVTNWALNSGTCSSNSFQVVLTYDNTLNTGLTCALSFFADGSTTGVLPSGFDWEDFIGFNNMAVSSTNQFGGTVTGSSGYSVATSYFNNGTSTVTQNLLLQIECFAFGSCDAYAECPQLQGSVVNPYTTGLRGNWRSKKSHLFLSDRTQTNIATNSNNLNIRKDGEYSSFYPFWADPSSGETWIVDATNLPYWTWNAEITHYSPYGFEVENKDALNRYSAAIYGYNNTLPKAVAANTNYQSFAFDGFEDYDFIYNNECCQEQFNFYGCTRDTNIYHTGKYSARIQTGTNLLSPLYNLSNLPPAGGSDDAPYTVKADDIIGYFSPTTTASSTKYILSYWVKKETSGSSYTYSYDNLITEVLIGGTATTLSSLEKSEIIDGWQRYQYSFTVPSASTATIQFAFTNGSGVNYYVDDIRIHPVNSSMKSFVYDPVSFRLMATLDERNFATIYEYDEEGVLLRVKKETEKGVMTIQESRNNSSKKI